MSRRPFLLEHHRGRRRRDHLRQRREVVERARIDARRADRPVERAVARQVDEPPVASDRERGARRGALREPRAHQRVEPRGEVGRHADARGCGGRQRVGLGHPAGGRGHGRRGPRRRLERGDAGRAGGGEQDEGEERTDGAERLGHDTAAGGRRARTTASRRAAESSGPSRWSRSAGRLRGAAPAPVGRRRPGASRTSRAPARRCRATDRRRPR